MLADILELTSLTQFFLFYTSKMHATFNRFNTKCVHV